ncbi:MAG: CarD family transcriptional regulator [Flavonifractor plautii]
MEYPVGRFAVLTEGQSLLGKKRRSKPVTNRQKLGSYADLSPGDLVVHEHHGVGRFLEMTKMTVDGVQKDYVKIAYAGGRRALRPRHPAGPGEQVHRLRGGRPGDPQALQAGGHRLGEGQDPGQEGRQGSGQGAHSALRRAAAPARLRLLPRFPLDEGV